MIISGRTSANIYDYSVPPIETLQTIKENVAQYKQKLGMPTSFYIQLNLKPMLFF